MLIKKIISNLLFLAAGLAVAIIFFFLFSAAVYYLDRQGACASDGKIWDENLRLCRDDCLYWSPRKGCIKLTAKKVEAFKKCRHQPADCLKPLYAEIFPGKCLNNGGAYNQDEGFCDFDFNLSDCRRLDGNWLYPPTCR